MKNKCESSFNKEHKICDCKICKQIGNHCVYCGIELD